MKNNELPSFSDLGVNVEELLSGDSVTEAEEFFNTFVDKHFSELSEDSIKRITEEAGNSIDDDPVDIEDFKGSLLVAFTLNNDGIEDPEEYIKVINLLPKSV